MKSIEIEHAAPLLDTPSPSSRQFTAFHSIQGKGNLQKNMKNVNLV